VTEQWCYVLVHLNFHSLEDVLAAQLLVRSLWHVSLQHLYYTLSWTHKLWLTDVGYYALTEQTLYTGKVIPHNTTEREELAM